MDEEEVMPDSKDAPASTCKEDNLYNDEDVPPSTNEKVECWNLAKTSRQR